MARQVTIINKTTQVNLGTMRLDNHGGEVVGTQEIGDSAYLAIDNAIEAGETSGEISDDDGTVFSFSVTEIS